MLKKSIIVHFKMKSLFQMYDRVNARLKLLRGGGWLTLKMQLAALNLTLSGWNTASLAR